MRDRVVDSLDVLCADAVRKCFNQHELSLLVATYHQAVREYHELHPEIIDSGLSQSRREDYDVAMRMYAAAHTRLYISSVVDSWHKDGGDRK